MMTEISYSGYRFPPEIIQQAIWLYVRFTLSFRDVEDLLAERGITVSYETVRRWVNHFGPKIAADLRKRRPKPHTTWHLDEVYLKIDGRLVYLWRAVDAEGEVLDVLVQTRRNKRAALKLMRKLLKKYGFVPDKLVTDDLRSYGAAAGHLGIAKRHERGRWRNNRAENSHQPTRRRERKMQGFKSVGSAQRFLSVHAATQNTFNVQRHLISARTHEVFRASSGEFASASPTKGEKMQGFKSVGSAQRFLSVHAATQNTFNVQRHLISARTHRAFRASALQTWREVVAAA